MMLILALVSAMGISVRLWVRPEVWQQAARICPSCVTAAEQALGDYRRFAELDVRFHSLLSRATGNQVAMIVTDVLGQVEQHTLLKKMETLNDSACLALERRILARHREILSAIRRQDDAAAKQAMREHTRAAATDLKV